MKTVYTAEATAEGGRNGKVSSSDDRLDLGLSMPESLGGSGGEGTNPEQLFAAGYAACFQSAMDLVASNNGGDTEGSSVTASVGLVPSRGAYELSVKLSVILPEMDHEQSRELVEQAHEVCPYSRATRDNVQVELEVV